MRKLFFFVILFFAISANAQINPNNVKSVIITNETSLLIQTIEFQLTVIPMANEKKNAIDYFEFSYFPTNNKEKWHHSYTVTSEKRMDLLTANSLKFQKYIGGNSGTTECYFIGNYIIEIEKQPYNIVIREFKTQEATKELANQYFNSTSILRDNVGLNWINEDHKISKNFDLQEDFFIGLGEKTGPVNRKGNAYTMWNSDVPAYGVEQDPLYVSIPFYIGGSKDFNYGIYVDHSSKSYFNFGAACDYSSISVEDDHLRYYVILGNAISDISSKYRVLTGFTPLPPKWSLGFHQSRWSYKSQDEVLTLASEFKKKNMPIDAIHLDIHYMDACKVFTFNQQQFPNPKSMVETLKKQGINIITILDPGIKVEKGYPAYESALKQNLFLKYPNGTNYEAGVWPGLCNFPDFTNPKAREWWSQSVKFYTDLGISGLWNDMNEPAAWGKEVPSYIRFNREGHLSNLTQNRNVYGMQMARATREGAEKLLNKRVFTLTRAGFAGIQRYAAVWTGDNVATDDHMMLSFKMLANMSLCGVDFVGADVGGFMNPATPELFTRWMSVAAFTPFYRAHKMIDMPSSEPWCFGDINTEINRYYMQLRYRLMPYIYSSMQQNETPVVQSIANFSNISTANYVNAFSDKFESQFVLGKGLLIAPARSNAKSTEVYLPQTSNSTNWYSIYNDEQYESNKSYFVNASMAQLPIFVKAGMVLPEIIPQKIENTENKSDTLNLHVYYNQSGFYEGYLYEDDGISLKNKDLPSGIIRIIGNSTKQEIAFQIEKTSGFNFPYKTIQFFIHGLTESIFNPSDDIPKPRTFEVNKQLFVANSANVTETKIPHFALKQDLYKVERIHKTTLSYFKFTCAMPQESFTLKIK
jgi:alpha-glucosidase